MGTSLPSRDEDFQTKNLLFQTLSPGAEMHLQLVINYSFTQSSVHGAVQVHPTDSSSKLKIFCIKKKNGHKFDYTTITTNDNDVIKAALCHYYHCSYDIKISLENML